MKPTLRKLLVVSVLAVQVFFYPVIALAETAPTITADPETQSLDQSQTSADAKAKPTGSEASSYIFNPATGLWENEYYTWDPVTKQTSPKTPPTYSYNPATGMWDTTTYKYDAATGKYTAQPVAVAKPPANAEVSQLPVTQPSTAASENTPATTSDPAKSTSGTNAYDLFYNNTISNAVTATAQTGDAKIIGNTTAGNATTGSASSMTIVLNMLQSSLSTQPHGVNTFTTDLNGAHFGDLTLDPNKLLKTGELSVQDNTNPSLTINMEQNNTITNNIDLVAVSGDALIEGNTSAGNASSGSALAVANVVNMINSSISTGQSFIGNINIYGDLDGDILLPDSVRQQLLSGNAPTTTLDTSKIENADVVANFTTNTQINNAVTTNAATGNATIADNTNAGNATTGNASTNLTVLNLTGHEVIGDNALLVFVNVMGKWVGAIMNAPIGTTAAALGNEGSSITASRNTSLNSSVTNTINNSINVQARSGDATVANNTDAGDATSGNASASANLANIANSSLSLADWFGVLFINVFGSWNGSFGQDTAAGGFAGGHSTPSASTNPVNATPTQVRAFKISSSSGGTYKLAPVNQSQPATQDQSTETESITKQQQNEPQVLSAASNRPAPPTPMSSLNAKSGMPWPVVASTIAFFVGIALMVTERLLAAKRRRRTQMRANTLMARTPIQTVGHGDSYAA